MGGQEQTLPTGDGLQLNPSSTSAPALNIPCASGVAPASPQDGDEWCTGAGLFLRLGGVTVGPLGAGGGAPGGTSGQLQYNNAGAFGGVTLSGGATLNTGTGVVTLGNPGASTLGGIESITCTAHQWLEAISTSGVPSCTQPGFRDVSGTSVGSGDVLGNSGSSSAAASDTTLSAILDRACGSTQGVGPYRAASAWTCLGPGLSGQVLQSGGSGANVSWSGAVVVGNALPQPSIRGSGIQSSSASNFTVSWPSGTAAGDFAIIFGLHGFNIITPPGWTTLANITGSSNVSGAAFSKVLTSGDITTGSVTVSAGGSFNGVFAIVTFVGSTTAVSVNGATLNTSGSSPRLLMPTEYRPGSMGLYFAANRNADNVMISVGSSLQAIQREQRLSCPLYGVACHLRSDFRYLSHDLRNDR